MTYDIAKFSPQSGRVICEDGSTTNIGDVLAKISGAVTRLRNAITANDAQAPTLASSPAVTGFDYVRIDIRVTGDVTAKVTPLIGDLAGTGWMNCEPKYVAAADNAAVVLLVPLAGSSKANILVTDWTGTGTMTVDVQPRRGSI
jgi:hypothetical protein